MPDLSLSAGIKMKVAITGGVGEGKSTILGWIAEEGWPVHSSDKAARAVFADPEVNHELARLAGRKLAIEPAELRASMLGDPKVRRRVNAFLHPLIGKLTPEAPAFFEVPLLIEACLQSRYDRVWVVTCGPEEQRRRLLDRYSDPALVEALIAVQLPTSEKLLFADSVFRTNAPFQHVRSLLRQALQELTLNGKCPL